MWARLYVLFAIEVEATDKPVTQEVLQDVYIIYNEI
jgi:hypothetical protein